MEYISVGQIVNTHGIKGDMKVYPYTDYLNRFSDLEKIYIGDEKTSFEVENVKYHKGMVLLKLKEFNNINEILGFKEKFIFIDEEDRIKLPEDNYFIYELIDCQVFDIDGKFIGQIKDVLQNASNDIYIVEDMGKEHLIPAVKEFIKEIDISKKKIIIDPIEGMIE